MFWFTVLFLIPIIYYYVFKPHQYWKSVGVTQVSKVPVPIIGDSWDNLSGKLSFPELAKKLYNSCPGTRYTGFYQFFIPSLLIKDPELIKNVLVKDFDHFINHRPFIPAESDPLWGKNIFQLQGERWKEMRAVVSPTFTTSKMRNMFTLMNDAAQNFTNHFLKQDKAIMELEMKDVFSRFANDVIASTAFGLKVDSLENPNNEFYRMGKEMTNFGFFKILNVFLYLFIPKINKIIPVRLFSPKVSNYFRSLITETIETREKENIIRPDLIHILMEARKVDTENSNDHKTKTSHEITDEDITAQAISFFFAGFDSVSGLMCFTCYELALNEECQNKLRQEIKETWDESHGTLTYEILLKMKYFEMVISESLRKWPNAAITDRVCNKDYTIPPVTPEEKPVHIKVGEPIWIPVYAIQRDPKYFPNPDKFDPERFNEENKDNIHPYTLLTFGGGPRNCIGSRFAIMEVKAVLFYLLLNFKLVPIKKTEIPLTLSIRTPGIGAKNGIWLGLEKL